jgi:hypothetical protein
LKLLQLPLRSSFVTTNSFAGVVLNARSLLAFAYWVAEQPSTSVLRHVPLCPWRYGSQVCDGVSFVCWLSQGQRTMLSDVF